MSRFLELGALAALGASVALNSNSCVHSYNLDLDSSADTSPGLVSSKNIATFERLNCVEKALIDLDCQRIEALSSYGFLLLIPGISERYKQACKHHELLFKKTRELKAELATCPGRELEIDEWAKCTNAKLQDVTQFIAYVKDNRHVPPDWEPPVDFEYLRTLNR